MDHFMDLSKAQRHKRSQPALSGGRKPLGKDEIPPGAGTSLTALLPRDVWWGMAPGITTPYSFLVYTDIFSTLLTTSSMPKNTSACFVTQSLSQRKSKSSFIELPAMALIEKCNTPRWVIGLIVTCEMCAIGARLRVYLSVHSTFVQLSQSPEPDVCRSSTFPSTCGADFPWLPAPCSLQNTRKTQFDTVLIYISMVSLF